MDSKELEQKWPIIQDKIRENHPNVNIDDLTFQIGKEAELLHQLGEKLKMNKAEIDKWLSMMG